MELLLEMLVVLLGAYTLIPPPSLLVLMMMGWNDPYHIVLPLLGLLLVYLNLQHLPTLGGKEEECHLTKFHMERRYVRLASLQFRN